MADNKRDQKMEDFWDIKKLLPPKGKVSRKVSAPPLRRTEPVTITIDIPTASKEISEEKTKLTTPQAEQASQAPSVFAVYHNFSPLTPKVEIINWKSTYNYYDFFCRQAASLYNIHGKKCDEVHFFSYVAQYSQLNRRQLDWYLWWRENVRNGVYLKVDVSYIHLLIFEIINLGNTVDTHASLNILLGLWKNYKDDYPQLRDSLGNWICDYSLIYNLPLQFPSQNVTLDTVSLLLFKKAFFSFDLADPSVLSKVFLSLCSSYDYKKSKFYQENKDVYDAHIPLALEAFFSNVDMQKLLSAEPIKHASISSFVGALCSHKMRKHIEVDYISLFDSPEIKNMIGDIVRYSENKIRMHLGIRSRLGNTLNNQTAKTCIDSYFAGALSLRAEASLPEYEKLYEVTDRSFSLESALNIEKQSWEVTEKLVEAFEEEIEDTHAEELPPPTMEDLPSASEEPCEREQFLSAIAQYRVLFDAILDGDFKAQRRYMEEMHLLPDAVIDEINEKATEYFSDILIEEDGEGYKIIEDYQSIFE